MITEIDKTQNSMTKELMVLLENATSIITKSYLDKLEKYDLIKPSEEDIDIDISYCGKFFKLSKLVFNKEENFLNKLTTIVNVASSINCTLATVIKSNGLCIDYYFGILSKNYRTDRQDDIKRRKADVTAFKGALNGNLTGSELEELSINDIENFRKEVFEQDNSCYSSISGIVALRDNENKNIDGYVQGIENLVDSLKGQKYTIIMFADPVNTSEIQTIKCGYEMLHTELSTFLRNSVILNENDSYSLAKARTEGVTEGISKGISMTQSRTYSKGKYMGVNASIGINFGLSANVGTFGGMNNGVADTSGKVNSTMELNQTSRQASETIQNGKGSGKSLQLNYENRSVKSLIDKIDKHLERLDECESFGAFNCAAYIIADTREKSLTIASNYNALMRGKESSVQSSHINSWYKLDDTKIISQYLKAFVHPRFRENKDSKIIVTPASIVSGNEIAVQIGLPKKSISGVTVIPMAPFGRNIQLSSKKNHITLGNLYHMGHNEGNKLYPQKVDIDIESLSMHTFITGSTGAGKSTAIYSILDKLMETPIVGNEKNNIKFLVIEPAKGEYKERFGYYNNVKVYGTNYKKTPLLRINPFSFPEDIHVLEHIERLIEIFNVCWPMYAAMPAILKDSIERAYIASGWKLDTSECKYYSQGKPLYPNFIDVLNQINTVMNESQYSSDSKGDYKGALSTRLKSLTNGLYGQIFTNNEISAKELFDENVIVDLSRTGSSETKALIMGLLVMKLQEYRMSQNFLGNQHLKHITVLEEAHNILKRTSTEQNNESSNILGKSVEMLANSIAEMRTYGEGFIIVDQAPGLMDMSVIRNTNTKIILRLPDLSDRELVGHAAGLNNEQILELSRLKTFVAAVYQNDWLEPVLCNIDTNFKETKIYLYQTPNEIKVDDKKSLIKFLISPIEKREKLDRNYIINLVDSCYKMPISSEVKIAFIKYIKATTKEEVQHLRGKIMYSIFNTENAFNMAKLNETNIKNWYNKMYEILDPDISSFEKLEQQKIISVLAKENVERNNSEKNIMLFENLMNFI